jgi:hypothetical protein
VIAANRLRQLHRSSVTERDCVVRAQKERELEEA